MTSTTKYTDYSHTRHIPIVDGDVTISNRFRYLGPKTYPPMRITQTGRNAYWTYSLRNTLVATLRVHNRQAQSINLLVTALKVGAGTPDFDDWQHVRFKQGQ